MKIGRSKGVGSTSGTKKSSSSNNDADVDFSQFISSGGAEATSSASTTQSIAQLDSLLAVQEVEDPLQKQAKKKARMRAGAILDKLDRMRLKMLTGDLTIGHMVDVADVVASHRDKIDDPQLTQIMDEIDLRAQVEIAKLSMASKDLSQKKKSI
ncbi:MAG: flagellar assembly protein FliX [Alphaproteobacteria bacterium]